VLVGGSNRTVVLQPISLGGASMSLLVLQHFISGFRGNDECLVASREGAAPSLHYP
jgi:hypothetical protein